MVFKIRISFCWTLGQPSCQILVDLSKTCCTSECSLSTTSRNFADMQGSTYQENFTCPTSKMQYVALFNTDPLIWNKTFPKSTCPTCNLTCPTPSGNGVCCALTWWAVSADICCSLSDFGGQGLEDQSYFEDCINKPLNLHRIVPATGVEGTWCLWKEREAVTFITHRTTWHWALDTWLSPL